MSPVCISRAAARFVFGATCSPGLSEEFSRAPQLPLASGLAAPAVPKLGSSLSPARGVPQVGGRVLWDGSVTGVVGKFRFSWYPLPNHMNVFFGLPRFLGGGVTG